MELDELDKLIERRASKVPDSDELEPSYAETVRRYNARRRDENREAWRTFHLEQAERIERCSAELIARHRAAATRLEDTP